MNAMSTYFTKLENYEDLEVSVIRATKINKVLKMIVKLNTIPRDEEFRFRERAMNILTKWKNVLDTDVGTPVAEEKEKDEKPKANGVQKEDSVETPAKETDGEKEKEEESKAEKTEAADEPMPDADAEDKKTSADEPAAEETDKTAPKADEEANKEKATEEKTEEKTEKTEEKAAAADS